MISLTPYSLRIGQRLWTIDTPQVMGILNVTPDSFFSGSRMGDDEHAIRARVQQVKDEGATMIDVGGYSTRPGCDDISPEEEMRRVALGVKACREVAPELIVSVDTFRADVARFSVEELGADIINDISGGDIDRTMFRTVAQLRVPYILMHMQGTPATMQQSPHYDNCTREVITYLAIKAQKLRELGVSDIIADPGFGFGKTVAHNYELMHNLEAFHELRMPLLVGISRKSMIYKSLAMQFPDASPENALNGTSVLNTYALMKGAHILRVHDVRAAVEAVHICSQIAQP